MAKKLPVPNGSKTVPSAVTQQAPKQNKKLPILPTLGRIKLGKKNEKGWPTRLNYISITPDLIGYGAPFTLQHYMSSLYSIVKATKPDVANPAEHVTRIYGLLPYNDPYKNLFIYRAVYSRSHVLCKSQAFHNIFTDSTSNPITAIKYNKVGDSFEGTEKICDTNCPMRDKCKVHGIFKMYPVIPKLQDGELTFPTAYLGGVLILRTVSWSITRDLLGGMTVLQEALGGLTGYVIQLDLIKKSLGQHIVNSLAISAPLPLHKFSYKSLGYDVSSVAMEAEDEDEVIDENVAPDFNIGGF